MGLFDSIGNLFESEIPDALGMPGPGEVTRGLTGQTGAEASLRAAQMQADEARASRELFTPIVEAGIAQIPELARGATVEGFGQNIGAILQGGSLDPLIQQRQRSADALMASRGLRRSGAAVQEAANIPADLAMQIEGELNRRRQSIAGQGQTGAGEHSRLSQAMGQALAGGALGAAQSQAQGAQNVAAIGTSLLAAFSDPRLKTNIEKIGEHKGLSVISWKWNDLAFIKYGFDGESIGFNAEEVRDKRPDCTFTEDGMLKVDYGKLLERVH